MSARAIKTCDEIPEGAWGVRHRPCGERWPASVFDDDSSPTDPPWDGSGALRCPSCESRGVVGYGGFVVVARGSLPAALDRSYSQVPDALWDHGAALGLTANERDLALLLWRFQRGKPFAYPAIETLVERTGLSDSTVRRTAKALEARCLLTVRRGVHRDGQRLANEYDVGPLWDALAAVVEGRDVPTCRSERPVATGHSDRQLAVTETAQVEPEQVQPEQVELPAEGRAEPDTLHDLVESEVEPYSPPFVVAAPIYRRYRRRPRKLPARYVPPRRRATADGPHADVVLSPAAQVQMDGIMLRRKIAAERRSA
ncbi:helix-turn-helix domain-containing protein [Baekduia soli]|uniref:Helix-turn-helix domain-containing protein n=1 Tax=Baekduia soli TaxID=496014 RepID=A0A5B8U8I8_9ACTN|nr:helix-turn-helix domain-containing protein [Baekduia soli]QEC49439.1 helix-turn-helix domain-containing protein [Baekduia soli]